MFRSMLSMLFMLSLISLYPGPAKHLKKALWEFFDNPFPPCCPLTPYWKLKPLSKKEIFNRKFLLGLYFLWEVFPPSSPLVKTWKWDKEGVSRLYCAGRDVGFWPRHPWEQSSLQQVGVGDLVLLQALVWAVQGFLKSTGVGRTGL